MSALIEWYTMRYMSEKPPMGDMRPKPKDILLPPDKAKEISDIIPKPENHFHYQLTGEWQHNREVYRVMEGDKVISDYTFQEKSDMSKVQFATRKTYSKEVNLLGAWTDQPVQFDRKTGKWKKLNILQRVKQALGKETNIPAQVVSEIVGGREVSVLHTLEQKRPIGETVVEAKVTTLKDAQVDLGLKYRHVEHKMTELEHANRVLQTEAATGAAMIATLRRDVMIANRKVSELNAQLRVQQARAQDQANQANPHYEGPIYTKPNPADVVEGEVVG